jgi:hypothetical protein
MRTVIGALLSAAGGHAWRPRKSRATGTSSLTRRTIARKRRHASAIPPDPSDGRGKQEFGWPRQPPIQRIPDKTTTKSALAPRGAALRRLLSSAGAQATHDRASRHAKSALCIVRMFD